MSFDENLIKEELKKHIDVNLTGPVDLDKVIASVEFVNGFYIFKINDVGFAFLNNTLIDVMPGYTEIK